MSLSADYRAWVATDCYHDLIMYIGEVLNLNRDILEGLKVAETESDDLVRGRCRALRDLLFYITEQCKEETDDGA